MRPIGDKGARGAAGAAAMFCTGGICFLCLAFSVLAIVLLLSIIFVGLDIRLGDQPLSLRVLIKEAFSAGIIPIVVFLGEIFRSLFPWPVVVLIVVALLAWGPDRLGRLLASLNLELPGGFKLSGGAAAPEAFKKEMGDTQKMVAQTNKEIEEAYSAAKEYVVQLRDRYGIDQLVERLAVEVARIIGDQCPDDFRLTVYVPDLIFEDRLYQLTEYYDQKGQRVPPNRSGRAFSIRYGIIGRVWRTGVSEIEGQLISKEDREQLGENPDVRDLEKFIARRWGLTLDEAVRIRPYPSYGAIRIERGEHPLGLIFFDSKKPNAFGNPPASKWIESAVHNSALAVALLEMSGEFTQWQRVQIFRNI